ncbi:autoinducer 2 sensor kinase/phosphatase luxQ [Pyricularia oryzae 70-15]|uniref:Autoinducer 2 sensor kinase/phosphatase luxQ n=1 Tax=Pyricularia oryzae (strain 70-15 / ATCC MYA-4617 / FGSC 8958) TaxID=242507 RepID=G4N1Z5_PYRO7|nr:autoinducer 2 sensor kinase/phosphatase luxQ [Pyricularia oryzae 70-15]EHA53305.1 autoinducer 2 sensor kinase/phosphatase luxQ [Pyricularia oryzae 70-15]KAI7912982.1 autoinducer 2 sensor kinase/phosphatase luxQ [Pyricularia oryzae]KAI7913030.1 autoinducer 2 sensor kinase/phosphatase luxQ [Pyricularia oryzae]
MAAVTDPVNPSNSGVVVDFGLPTPPATDPVDELNSLTVLDVLDSDSRPTFVLDLDPDTSPERLEAIVPVFCNAALRQHERLYDGIVGLDASGVAEPSVDGAPEIQSVEARSYAYHDFRRWATGVTPHDDSKDVFPLSILYADLLWTGSTVHKRWRIVSGNRLWRFADTDADSTLAELNPDGKATSPFSSQRGGRSPEDRLKRQASNDATVRAQKQDEKAKSLRLVARERKKSIALDVVDKPVLTIALPSDTSPGATLVSSSRPPNSLTSYFPPDGSSNDTGTGTGSSSYQPTIPLKASVPEKAVADWTVPENKLQGVLTEHLKFARSVDWANTPLGPMESWSAEFRQVANLIMTNPFPAALFWGSELTMLYNEAYAREVAGNKHPSLMGTGFSGPFAELWDYAGPVFAECARTGVAVRKENDYLPIDRHSLLEETFYSWGFVPLYGGTSRILGFYNAPFETTTQVLNQRYLTTINNLGAHAAHAKTVKQFWKRVLESLAENIFDVPFALLYSVGDSGEDEENTSTSSGSTLSLKSCYLEGTIAVPEGHVAAPKQLDLKRSWEGFVPTFREAMRTREPTLLHTRDGTLPESLLEGITWRGFGDPCREAIIFPVRPTNGDVVMAFLVLGVNPRRPLDDAHRAFISMLNRQLATSLASAILFEDEVRRGKNAAERAALEKEQLTEQLTLQANRLRRMTEMSPLGMFLIDPDGVLREANERFYEMTGVPRDRTETEFAWLDFVHDNSRALAEEGWARLVKGATDKNPSSADKFSWSTELQIRQRGITTSPVNLQGDAIDFWVLINAHSEFASDGSLRSIMGSITDISHLKWAQGLQQRQLQEAEETRRQQNEFIDITSHEMRNPLSAILQCADDISTALAESSSTQTPPRHEVVESCVDAAQTIALCVQHQKSIVDDILTISKLDSSLLHITPLPARPQAVVRRAVKMFDPELQAKKIKCRVETDPSYSDLAVDWVMVDQNRTRQILINLITNAIKFTAPAEERIITVKVAASRDPPDPTLTCSDFEYVEPKHTPTSHNFAEDWPAEETVYVRFQVQDTGCGLSIPEKQMLFQRFRQASPRTHAQYGGSGLGLFISKRLAELHGGQIGVASTEGKGSLFGFYVQARRAAPLAEEDAAVSDAQGLRMEQHFGADSSTLATLNVTPQRQDYAGGLAGPDNNMVVRSKSSPAVLNDLAAAAETQPKILDPRELHVLVVEDNLINQKVLASQLRKAGCTVHTANDGLEALEFLETTAFRVGNVRLSVILMDLEMPNMDGLTCVSEIRRMEVDGRIETHVPVIAVTANVRDEQVTEARRSGMDDVLSKPFRVPTLFDKIGALLLGGARG